MIRLEIENITDDLYRFSLIRKRKVFKGYIERTELEDNNLETFGISLSDDEYRETDLKEFVLFSSLLEACKYLRDLYSADEVEIINDRFTIPY